MKSQSCVLTELTFLSHPSLLPLGRCTLTLKQHRAYLHTLTHQPAAVLTRIALIKDSSYSFANLPQRAYF